MSSNAWARSASKEGWLLGLSAWTGAAAGAGASLLLRPKKLQAKQRVQSPSINSLRLRSWTL